MTVKGICFIFEVLTGGISETGSAGCDLRLYILLLLLREIKRKRVIKVFIYCLSRNPDKKSVLYQRFFL
jgi:hypothetical protein